MLLKTAYEAGVKTAFQALGVGGTAATQVANALEKAPALTKSVGTAGLKNGITPGNIGPRALGLRNGVAK